MKRLTILDEEKDFYRPTPFGKEFLVADDGSNAARLLQYIGPNEDLEEEFGAPLIEILRAVVDGIYIKDVSQGYSRPEINHDVCLKGTKLYLCPLDIYEGDYVETKDFGKTWSTSSYDLRGE